MTFPMPASDARRALRVAVVALALAATSACTPPPSGAPPNMVVILVDTLRADRLGVYGNQRGLTPFMDELASRGTVFTNAYAPSSWTCPSVASLFTSRFASQHGVNDFDAKLADSEVTFAEVLTDRGYVAGGFSANLRMQGTYGYGQGFAEWHAYMGSHDGNGIKPRGKVLRRESLGWLRPAASAEPKPPLFLYLQYMEPHTPYDPIEPFRSTFGRGSSAVDEKRAHEKLMAMRRLSDAEIERLESLYDGEVAAVDAEIRVLFAELEQLGFLENALIVVTADHGEEFGEHGVMLHGFTLFNGAMRVPLIIVAPGFGGGRVVDDNVSLVDVAPTLLELAGIPAPPSFEGRSLVPLMSSPFSPIGLWTKLVAAPDVIGEIEPYGDSDRRRHAQAIVSGANKLLVSPKGETSLFDLSKDPAEVAPLDGSDPSRLLTRLTDLRAELKAHAVATTQGQPIDDATKEKLRALGYHP
jgi:arylsulfatase A-like enzyme